jgi:hypothetical protein
VIQRLSNLRSLSSESSSELEILGLDGNSLGVDSGQVGVFKQGNEVSLGSFLKGSDGGRLESEISLEILGDFSDQSLEREFSDEELGRSRSSVQDLNVENRTTYFWYRLISLRATVPGLYLWGFLTPPVAAPADLDAVFRAALVATGG